MSRNDTVSPNLHPDRCVIDSRKKLVFRMTETFLGMGITPYGGADMKLSL